MLSSIWVKISVLNIIASSKWRINFYVLSIAKPFLLCSKENLDNGEKPIHAEITF